MLIHGDDITEYGRLRDELDRQAEQSATANEELQSTNEELETTNEELETTVEELQSMNAELGALNGELERRTAELHHADAFQRGILEILGGALFVLDPDFVVTHWNGAAALMWGLRSEAAIGRDFLSLPIGEVTRLAHDPLQRVKETRSPARIHALTHARPGGEQRRASVDLAPILSPIGELLGIIGVATDVESERGHA